MAKWPERDGKKIPWETCQTFSGSWGYYRDEYTWKSPAQLLELLVESVSKGGNLLLNVGPTARGTFDDRAQASLKAMGEWTKLNGRSVYGCTEAPAGFVGAAEHAVDVESRDQPALCPSPRVSARPAGPRRAWPAR